MDSSDLESLKQRLRAKSALTWAEVCDWDFDVYVYKCRGCMDAKEWPFPKKSLYGAQCRSCRNSRIFDESSMF